MTNPYVHDPKTPTNFRQPRPIPEHVMNKHKHADLMAAYAADAQTTDKPWELWEREFTPAVWVDCIQNPTWNVNCGYRRKPQTHTIVLNTEQLKEILLACEYPSWENGDFVSGVQVLQNALGVQPKTNEQLACGLLEKAHAELEAHSAEICEPNVDHIQKLVWDARQLLSKGDGE